MLGDFDFPTQEDYDVIEDYLTRKNACAEAKKPLSNFGIDIKKPSCSDMEQDGKYKFKR